MARLLVVEDDELIARMLTMRLSMKGHVVEHAINGLQGVEKALAGDYDLVLLDMHMPVMDGHAAIKQLRSDGYTKPVVAVTASAMSEDSHKAIAAGCDGHISKPIGPDFEEIIEGFLVTKAGS